MIVDVFKVTNMGGGSINDLYINFGSNIPNYVSFNDPYTAYEYLCCVDIKVKDIEEICNKNRFLYYHLDYINIDPKEYNNQYRISIDYYAEEKPYYLVEDYLC